MNACDELVGVINGAITAAYRINKQELKDIKKQTLDGENILRE